MKIGETATFDSPTNKMTFLWASRSARGIYRNENGVKNSRILERSLSHIQHQADSWNHRPTTKPLICYRKQ